MQSKPQAKKWKDVQLVVSALAVTLTLGFWNLIASPKKPTVGGQSDEANLNPQTASNVTISPALPLLPGQILLLGGAVPTVQPQTSQSSLTTQPAKARSHKGGGGGTVTSTHSSHP